MVLGSALGTQFRARHRGDVFAESWTHVDGIIGHFQIRAGRGDVRLEPGAQQLVIAEAKMFSDLSRGTKRAPTFDQAARNVACAAELASGFRSLKQLAFVVLAPTEQLARGTFDTLCDRGYIRAEVSTHVNTYGDEKGARFETVFLPVVEVIEIHILSWEGVITSVGKSDPAAAEMLYSFYTRRLEFNRPRPAIRAHR